MSRLKGKALEYDIANTIVEDSEPERVAAAAKEKEARRGRKKRRQEQSRENKSKLVDGSHDIGVPDSLPTSSAKRFLNGKYCEESTQVKNTDVIKDVAKHPSAPVPDDSGTILPPITLTIRQCSPQNAAEESNFKRFVTRYTLPPTTSHSQPASIPNSNLETTKPKATKTKKPSNASSSCLASFTRSQLAKLNKCYICNLTWTARKTIPTKLAHIQSCAKKHGWSEETLLAVFGKELHIAEPIERNNSLPDSVIPLETSHSLLETIKDGTAAHRKQLKGRPQQKSVLDPSRAHSAILERAKNLFDTSNQHLGQPSETADGFPSTQAFQPSKLNAVTQGLFARAMLEENERRDIPTTQQFEAGKSGSLLSVSMNSVARSHSIPYQPTYSFIDTFTTRNSENADFLTISQKAIDDINRRLHAIQLGATNEKSAPVQTNHNVHDANADLPLQPTPYLSPEKTQENLPPDTNEPKLTHISNVDDLDVRLCQIIQQNDALYERILRYEPLHFDVFMCLEGIKEMDGRGFRNKLQAFLDRHCISFYTDSALGSNRRRW